MKGILGVKLGMTQVIAEDGVVTPVTIIQAGPCYVLQVKTKENDGYTAVQVGYGEAKERRLSRGQRGHLGLLKTDDKHAVRKNLNDVPPVKHLREFRTEKIGEYEVGQVLTVEQFEIGDKIDVTGKTKGRGFQGGVKRHGFGGGPKTHGQSDRWRAPGSIGATSSVARVLKGTRMAGHMGDKRKTVQNLEVIRIDLEKNLIAVKGPVPGAKGSLVVIRDAVKAKK
ncbi:MAG: 50S ribosomal protein L3 [Anaerolineales bacterium]|nr:50S ribosomal protein L3 [Anaerolineales bacterium]